MPEFDVPELMQSFALMGAGGYIAPRHMQAIKAVGGDLKVIFDPNDSVGVIDSFFPEASFFVEFERFDRHVDKLRRRGERLDYMSICSPNYLHDAHVRFALRSEADAICEKPLVLNPWNIDGLAEMEGRPAARFPPSCNCGCIRPFASSSRGSTPRRRTNSLSILPT
jgi:UDP-N-acetyl-2-amino-2-deoxyglucuronate dehydrogenase